MSADSAMRMDSTSAYIVTMASIVSEMATISMPGAVAERRRGNQSWEYVNGKGGMKAAWLQADLWVSLPLIGVTNTQPCSQATPMEHRK